MDYLQLAKDSMDAVLMGATEDEDISKRCLMLIQTYVAIAQAEQTKRLADALENISGIASIDLPVSSNINWADYNGK